jgi:hypothetical protein
MTPPDGGQAPSNVVAFQPRAAAGDWTAAELQRLAELSRKLEAEGAHVGAVYGVSDAGDPWCVITNDADEVLMHVARIGGRFVIHDAAADALQDGDTLWSACDRLLGHAWRDGREDGVVIPLHQAQALLALVAALIFEHEGRPDRPAPAPVLQTAHTHAEPAGALTVAMAAATIEDLHGTPRAAALAIPDENLPGLRTASLAPTDARAAGPAAAASPLDPASSAGAGPAHAAAADPVQLAAAAPGAGPGQSLGDAGRVLTGGHGGDVLVGGPGDDTLAGGGAGHGQIDLLLGGGGSDRLIMAERTVAVGGAGHDVFVFSRTAGSEAHPHPQGPPSLESGATATSILPPPTSLAPGQPTAPEHPTPEHPTSGPTAPPPLQGGVIMDFTTEDRLDFGPGGAVTVVGVKAVSDVLAGLHEQLTLAVYGATPGEAVDFDFNGDGVADLTVLVAGSGAASLTVGTRIAGAAAAESATDHAAFMATIHTLVPGAFLLG